MKTLALILLLLPSVLYAQDGPITVESVELGEYISMVTAPPAAPLAVMPIGAPEDQLLYPVEYIDQMQSEIPGSRILCSCNANLGERVFFPPQGNDCDEMYGNKLVFIKQSGKKVAATMFETCSEAVVSSSYKPTVAPQVSDSQVSGMRSMQVEIYRLQSQISELESALQQVQGTPQIIYRSAPSGGGSTPTYWTQPSYPQPHRTPIDPGRRIQNGGSR